MQNKYICVSHQIRCSLKMYSSTMLMFVFIISVISVAVRGGKATGMQEEISIKQKLRFNYSHSATNSFTNNYKHLRQENSAISIKTDVYFNYRRAASNTAGEKRRLREFYEQPAIEQILRRTKRFNFNTKATNIRQSRVRRVTQNQKVEQMGMATATATTAGTVEFYFTGKENPAVANNSEMFINNSSSVQQPVSAHAFLRQLAMHVSDNGTVSATRIRSSGELKFLDVPPGGGMRTPALNLDDGYSIFNFISSLLACLQTDDFPVGLLQDWLWNGVTAVHTVVQIVRVEGGVVACVAVLVLLALALPSAVLVQVSCHLNESTDAAAAAAAGSQLTDTQLRYRKLALVILLELMLILLPLGIVGMFLSNEHLSRSVNRSPEVAHAVLEDMSTFVRNTQLQIRFVATTSVDQAVDAAVADLEDVEELLGRPIQRELASETGVDVALDALSDICSASVDIATEVSTLRAEAQAARDTARTCHDRLNELRKQIESTRSQCVSADRAVCDTIDTSGLEVTFKVDKMLAERKLSKLRHLGEDNLTSAADGARLEYQDIPQRVERVTLPTRQAIKDTLTRQRETLHRSVEALEEVSRDMTAAIQVGSGYVSEAVRAMMDMERWRWLAGLGTSLSVLVVWCLLMSAVVCMHCGCDTTLIPTFLIALALICLVSMLLGALASGALVLGANGELFVCRPLYDSPNYATLTLLLDNPGLMYKRGGLFSNLLRANHSMDVPVKVMLRECRLNQPAFPTFTLNRIFNIDAVTNHLTWPKLHGHLANLTVNINDIEILKPRLQKYLQDLAQAARVNLTMHRTQLSGAVMAADLNAFADQLERVANQMTDLTTSARMETLAARCRKLFTNNLQRLEKHRDEIVYRLTALEVHLLPLQRQANQSLSHLKTIQYYMTNQGSSISERKTNVYVAGLVKYLERFREHVLNQLTYEVAPCRPLWHIYHTSRVQLCKHLVATMNGFWVSTAWCLVMFIIITPIIMILTDYYRNIFANGQFRRDLGELLLNEQGPWTTSGPHTPESMTTPEQSSWTTTPRRPSEQLLIPAARYSYAAEQSRTPPRRPTESRASPRPRHESLRMIEQTTWRAPGITSPRGWL